MKDCDYGCGQEAKHQLKNGKWCCSKSQNSCPKIKNRLSKNHANFSGSNNPMFGKKHSKISIEKNRKSNTGNPGPMLNKKHSDETKEKMQIAKLVENDKSYGKKLTIKIIKKSYKFFSKIEEMRYNPDKPKEKEIQVRCKNAKCENSKEKDGWFTPTYIQFYERVRQLEKDYGNDGSYLYCSPECKDECVLYRLRSDQDKSTSREVQPQLRQMRFELDNYTCQKCGKHQDELDVGLHCHHLEGIRWEPIESADLDTVITLCKTCHIEVHKKEGCGYHDMRCM